MSIEVVNPNGQVASETRAPQDFFNLLGIARDAVKLTPPLYLNSIFGLPWTWLPPHHEYSEFRIIDLWKLRRSLKFLMNIALPSLPRTPPTFGPPFFNNFFWQPSVILQRPDHNGSYTSFPDEAWFYINGICTNDSVAQINAAYLADLFHRPLTLIQNSTGSIFEDLLECMLGKEWQRTTEAATKAFPPVYDALKSRHKQRVIVICHSQGTIIMAVVLRLLSKLTRKLEVIPALPEAVAFEAPRYEGPMQIYPRQDPIDLEQFDPLDEDELAKLEIYAFANCANEMKHHPAAGRRARPIPWIESYGNECDLVARLGMLAPRPEQWGIQIDGPRYEQRGRWGHLLNEHYLVEIDKRQRMGYRKRPRGGSAPYVLAGSDEDDGQTPRLFYYINGGTPED